MTRWKSSAALLLLLAAGACDSDKNGNTITGAGDRVYSQIERLGNPLVSEVFFMKRDHGLHNTTPPDSDVARQFGPRIEAFVLSQGRTQKIATTLSAVLVPDMLMVFPNRPANTAGWLSNALAAGYGGRKLQDDVVDAGLTAIYGNLLDPSASVVAGLTSDNVPPSVRSFSATFPYLESPR